MWEATEVPPWENPWRHEYNVQTPHTVSQLGINCFSQYYNETMLNETTWFQDLLHFTFRNPLNPYNNIRIEVLIPFIFIDKDTRLDNFIEWTEPRRQNLGFHIGKPNYKTHHLPTKLCSLPYFPCPFAMSLQWTLHPSHSSHVGLLAFSSTSHSGLTHCSLPLSFPRLLLFFPL